MNKVHHATILIVLLCAALFARAAGTHQAVEHQLKAAFLYKFAAYVEWPATAFAADDAPLIIGVVGSDEMASELIRLNKNLLVNNRTVQIKSLAPGDKLDNLHILFIGRRIQDQLPSLLQEIREQPILTVTESRGALKAGSTINFIPVDTHIRFEISVNSAELSRIKISARLLDVAQHIEKRSSP